MLGWKRLALKINVRAQVDNLPYSPAETHPNNTAENAHRACRGKEQFLRIAVAGANGFHDSNLAPALENCHHQRIHDSDEGDSQGEAAEDSEKHVQHFEELLDAFAGIENRERVKAHLIHGVFNRLNMAGIFHAPIHRTINRPVSR